jgi:hypothetical protein
MAQADQTSWRSTIKVEPFKNGSADCNALVTLEEGVVGHHANFTR